jgi:hypothetical protein
MTRLTLALARATLDSDWERTRGMTIMRHAWAWSVGILLTACAASPPPPPTLVGPPTEEVVNVVTPKRSDLICTVQRPTGSQIAERQCLTRAEADRIRESSQEWMLSGGSHGSPIYVRDPADPRDQEQDE